jgi:hypothetical protein
MNNDEVIAYAQEIGEHLREFAQSSHMAEGEDGTPDFHPEAIDRGMIMASELLMWASRVSVFTAFLCSSDPSYKNIKELEPFLEPKSRKLQEELLKLTHGFCRKIAGDGSEGEDT